MAAAAFRRSASLSIRKPVLTSIPKPSYVLLRKPFQVRGKGCAPDAGPSQAQRAAIRAESRRSAGEGRHQTSRAARDGREVRHHARDGCSRHFSAPPPGAGSGARRWAGRRVRTSLPRGHFRFPRARASAFWSPRGEFPPLVSISAKVSNKPCKTPGPKFYPPWLLTFVLALTPRICVPLAFYFLFFPQMETFFTVLFSLAYFCLCEH